MERPAVVPLEGLPERVTIYEVGARDGLQNEAALVPTEVKAELITRLLDAGLPIVEATSFVHPKWVPQLADAAELMALLGDRGPRPARARAQRAGSRPGAGAGLPAHRDLRQRDRDLRGQEPQQHPRRPVRDVRADRTPRARRRRRRAGLRLDVLRRPVGGRRPRRAGRHRRQAALRPRCLPAEHRRHHRRRHRRPRDRAGRRLRRIRPRHRAPCDALPRHLRPGARQHPGGPARRHHDVRRQRRRPRRLPVREERHRQPRHRGPRLAADRPRHRARRRPDRAGRDQHLARRPPGPPEPVRSRARPWRAYGHNRGHESGRPPAHRCTEDGDDVPAAPPLPQRARAGQARRPHPDQEPAGLPGAVPVPRGAGPAGPGLGRPARARRRGVAPARRGGCAARTAPASSATRSSRRRRPT